MPTMLLALVDDIGIAWQNTLVAFNNSKSIKPAELWNVESSTVGPLQPCGERDADDRPREDIYAWIETPIISFLDTDNRVKMLLKMLNDANVLLEWNNFHSVSGFFVCTEAYSSITQLRKTQALLPESLWKTLDMLDNSSTSKQITTRSTSGIWRI